MRCALSLACDAMTVGGDLGRTTTDVWANWLEGRERCLVIWLSREYIERVAIDGGFVRVVEVPLRPAGGSSG